jgi:hypothetical protein
MSTVSEHCVLHLQCTETFDFDDYASQLLPFDPLSSFRCARLLVTCSNDNTQKGSESET